MNPHAKHHALSQKPLAAILVIAVLSGLYASSLYSYLLFHTLVELFSILVAFVVFVLAWNTRRVQDNHYLLFLGIALLFTGALEMVHTLAYKGFGVFPGDDANLPTQLWIAFRYLFSLSFLVSPLFIKRRLNVTAALVAYFVITTLLFGAIFQNVFPDCYVAGRGLTQFKIVSEYAIIFIFVTALVLLIRERRSFDGGVLRSMAGSIFASVLAELSFTQYVSVFGPANMIGHFFLLVSMGFIYRAIIVTGIVEPFRLQFRKLKLSEEALQKAHDMLEQRVRERTADLARANEEMEAEIADRMRAEAAVRTLNRELEQRVVERTAQLETANKELESFAYSVSHDLRAPLRSIDGFTQAIEQEQASRLDDTGRDYLRRVRAAADKMMGLINALLDLSRLSGGELKRVSVDLSAFAKEVADELSRTQPERAVEFVIPDGLTVEGDAVMLRAVVENLLGNAWKFTGKRDAAKIEFGAVRRNGSCAYFVRDNGAGFDMAYAGRLFCAFQRFHAATDYPGSGIGLATVQRIVHRHGGKVWAEGEPEKGATFFFTL
jgi:signal transduction histidine kinase